MSNEPDGDTKRSVLPFLSRLGAPFLNDEAVDIFCRLVTLPIDRVLSDSTGPTMLEITMVERDAFREETELLLLLLSEEEIKDAPSS